MLRRLSFLGAFRNVLGSRASAALCFCMLRCTMTASPVGSAARSRARIVGGSMKWSREERVRRWL